MALQVLRLDQREETRASEIVQDWRKWATDNGYLKKKSVPVEQGRMSITLETWVHPAARKDKYLFYHPEIPTTTDTEVLYITNDKEKLERLVGLSRHLAADLMKRIQRYADGMNGTNGMNGHAKAQ